MTVYARRALMVAATLLAGLVCFAQVRPSKVLWLDFDMKDIPEPKERGSSYYDYFIKGQILEGMKEKLDVPRWVRRAAGQPKQAVNVNALDEVPDSSWYTNRIHLRGMTIPDLQRGPNRGNPPDFSKAVITKAKPSGVTPGLMVKDATGQEYLIKFDGINYPNLQSGAEVIVTKILYAAGYNVPENYVAYIDPKKFEIGKDVEITDLMGQKRPLNQDDLDAMLRRVAKAPDGRLRFLASKFLAGKPKGPFPQVGLRMDDPNDLIPHEHRRELRGFWVIASWLNDWDLKEAQSMDMYVEENGRKFLRHYLLDFGASLGADDKPTEYYHGHEYGFDVRSIAKEIFSLGIYESANEKHARIFSSEIGNFTSHDFDPGNWKQTYPSVMFDNLTDVDAFWASRVILSFSENDLRSVIETAQYSNPETNKYMLQTLMERRQAVAQYWLGKVDGLAKFVVSPGTDGVKLAFHDLMADQNLVLANSTTYTYQVSGHGYKSPKRTVEQPEVNIGREMLAAAIEHGRGDSSVEVSIWTNRRVGTSPPVRVSFDWSPNDDNLVVKRIARG